MKVHQATFIDNYCLLKIFKDHEQDLKKIIKNHDVDDDKNFNKRCKKVC